MKTMPTLQDHPKVPKYWKLADQLRGQMQSGELQPGDRMPSLVEMQQSFAVSRGTVEKMHTLLEQDGLIVREQGRGTFVARPKPRTATGLIGFIGETFAFRRRHHAHAHTAEGVEEIIFREEKRLLSLDADCPIGWDRVDGILVCRPSRAAEAIRRLPHGLPCVSLLEEVEGVPSVVADETVGDRQAVEHLVALGHRRIACLLQRAPVTARRAHSYQEALRVAGIEPQADWLRQVSASFGEAADYRRWGREIMQSWLREGWSETGCTALLAQNDNVAVGILEALREANIAVPGQVSVVGFDGTEICDYVTPALSAIEVPLRQIGAQGMELLLRQIKEPESAPQVVTLPTRLQVRASTAAPPR